MTKQKIKQSSTSVAKRPGKKEREQKVLLGLVELYIRLGKPVGSNTLRENGFQDLSSATIRNYFANLEATGYLAQQHASGGRVPTHLAYRAYAAAALEAPLLDPEYAEQIETLKGQDSREIANYLQQASDTLSSLIQMPVFISAPRFDHDFLRDIKLVLLDESRCLCVLITDFGMVHTEVLRTPLTLTEERLDNTANYFRARLNDEEEQIELDDEEKELAQTLYNEVMIRYIVSYSNFIEEDIYRTGFSQLLGYPDFGDVAKLAGSLSLFENIQGMRLILRECCAMQQMKYWIGDDLTAYTAPEADCAVIAAPYKINQSIVGGIALLGPARIPYRELFGAMKAFCEIISEELTKSVFKFRISFRQPSGDQLYLEKEESELMREEAPILLEDQRCSTPKVTS